MRETNFSRRDLGQIIVAFSIIEDSIGWIIIGVILGVVGANYFGIWNLATTVLWIALFLAASLSVGRPLVAHAIRIGNDAFAGEYLVLTLSSSSWARWRSPVMRTASTRRWVHSSPAS